MKTEINVNHCYRLPSGKTVRITGTHEEDGQDVVRACYTRPTIGQMYFSASWFMTYAEAL